MILLTSSEIHTGKCLYPYDYLKDHIIQVEFQGVYHSLAAEYLFILQLNSCLWLLMNSLMGMILDEN